MIRTLPLDSQALPKDQNITSEGAILTVYGPLKSYPNMEDFEGRI
jgi:hypothetical protein